MSLHMRRSLHVDAEAAPLYSPEKKKKNYYPRQKVLNTDHGFFSFSSCIFPLKLHS